MPSHRRFHHARALLAPLLVALLGACGGGGGGGDPAAPAGPLAGAANGLAKAAIQTVDTGDTYTQAEVSVSPAGEEIIRTRLQIVFRPEATVGQVNTLLTGLDAVITTSIANFETVVVRIPDPGTLDELDAIVTAIGNEPFVWFVARAILPATTEIPGNVGANSTDGERIRHHLAVGAHGAWNARAAIADFPTVIVVDFFGDGAPNDDLDYFYVGDPNADFASGNPDSHGYHVAGIIAGRWGGAASDRERVTGSMPGLVRLSVIDLRKTDPLTAVMRLLLRVMAVQGGTVIVSTSLGFGCTTDVTCLDENFLRTYGAWWNQAVRSLGLENRFLHLTSAGNIKEERPSVNQARYNWYPGAASLLPGLTDANGGALAALTNVLAVENARAPADWPYDGPACQIFDSFRGGHLAGIGEDVWSFTNAGTTADYKSGTSMSTPQVAGLAAYLLAIRPELTPQQLAALLLETAVAVPVGTDAGCSDWPTPAPLIQPYAAALALDRPDEGPAEVPVRRAILDVDANGSFDEADIEAFLLAFETAQGEIDFGAADLNNDGRTGGDTTRPFDLDLDRFRAASGVTATILGETYAFDETALTDVAILCYYAYSSLYTGSAEARELLLEPYRQLGQCGEASEYSVSATLQGRMFAGLAVPLWVTVSGRNGPVEGASVSVTAEGGSAGGGVTDAAGRMESFATIDADAEFLTLTITVTVDGEAVGERVLQAERAVPAIASGGARVPCCSLSNISSGLALSPPGGTFSNAVVPSRTITWILDPGVPPGEPTVGKMHRFAATGHDVTLVVSFGSTSTSDDVPTYVSLAVETFGPVPRNAYRLIQCPRGISVPTGDCVFVAGNIEAVIGAQVVPPPGNPGTVALLRDQTYTLTLYAGSIAGDSFDVDMLFSRDVAAPVE